MTSEEEEDQHIPRPLSTDICSQINLISSIQYQQTELSKLAKLLHSEKDREKYRKVIEMSSVIQSKLDTLQDEKTKTYISIHQQQQQNHQQQPRINSFGQYLDKKNSMWSLNNYYYTSSCRSSTASSSSCYYNSSQTSSSENTLATSHHSSMYCISPTRQLSNEEQKEEKDEETTTFFNNNNSTSSNPDTTIQSRYHQHNYNGHSYRLIDRATSLHFQNDSVYNSRRPSADTILVDLLCLNKQQEKVYVKPLQRKKSFVAAAKRASSFIAAETTSIRDSVLTIESDEDEEIVGIPIHVAVRRDASLIKIVASKSHSIKDTVDSGIVTTDAAIPVVPPIPPQYLIEQLQQQSHHQKYNNSTTISTATPVEKKRVSFSDEKTITRHNPPPQHTTTSSISSSMIVNHGLWTPPDSPYQKQFFADRGVSSSESSSYFDLNILAPMINVQKKTHSSLRGLLKRTFQLNQYSVTKTTTNSITTNGGILYKDTAKHKLLLKLLIVSLDKTCNERQKRFGFTFWWQQKSHDHHQQQQQESGGSAAAKFALAPDSLVKEALVTWIEESQGVMMLPKLSQADEILRDGRKIYIVYDEKLFISSS